MRMQSAGGTSAALAVAAIVLAAVSFLAVNSIAGIVLRSARADLTEDRRFTLTGTTRSILSDLRQPVALHLYQSDALIEFGSGAARLCGSGARDAARLWPAFRRQTSLRALRPAALLDGRGQRAELRPVGHSPEQQRRARLFRPGRDEQRRRAEDDRFPRPGARAVPRIRPDAHRPTARSRIRAEACGHRRPRHVRQRG